MNDDNRISLKLEIGDRSYSLRVTYTEEQKLLKAAQQINEKLKQYRGRYSDKDMQDFFAMTALQLASRVMELEEKQQPQQNDDFVDATREISNELESYLKSIQRS
ncbi:MAG: hypothetical protein RIS47_31 [Bacteroidota bacterium]|jgi:cell division protein ZapA